MTNKRRTLFIHIGWYKTGTTSIQAMLRQNRDHLERERRLLYPRTGQGGNAHHDFANQIVANAPDAEDFLNRLHDELEQTRGWETAVISSEILGHATEADVKKIATVLTGDWDLRAICYLRLPDEYLEALFAELVKSGTHQQGWDEFLAGLDSGDPNYLRVIRRWGDALGEDAMVVRPFERASFRRGDLIADFFEAIGLPDAEADREITVPPKANVSPDAATLSIMRETARKLDDNDVSYTGYFLKSHLCDAIQENLPRTGKPRPPVRFFSTDERKTLRKQFQPTFEELGVHFKNTDHYPDEPEEKRLLEFDELEPTLMGETLMAGLTATTAELASIHCDAEASKQVPKDTPASEPVVYSEPKEIDPDFRPTLYVHIGHGKTGSTTIQQALRDNIDTLRKKGLLVADRNLQFPETGKLIGHPLDIFDRMLRNTHPEKAAAELVKLLDSLRHRLAAGGFRGAVISSENLSNGAELFSGATDKFDVQTIYYVRRQDEWLESAWKQWGIKTGSGIEDYSKKSTAAGRPEYLFHARAWKEVSSNIHVAPLNGVRDLVADFWSVLGIADPPPVLTSRRNQTFDWSILDLLSQNPQLFSEFSDNTIFQTLESLIPKDTSQEGDGLLPAEICDEIVEHHRTANEQLHAEFFPNYLPLHDYPRKGDSERSRDGWGSIGGVQRYLGFQLLMLGTLDQRLNTLISRGSAADPNPVRSAKVIAKLKEQTASLKTDNKDLQKQIKFLSRKIAGIDKKMARSLIWRLKKLLRIG